MPSPSKDAEPIRRSTRTPKTERLQSSQQESVQCTWVNCNSRFIHFHPLSEDPLQHYLPRSEHEAPIVDAARTDTESVSHHEVAEPLRRSTRTPKAERLQSSQQEPVQCTWVNCNSRFIHFHPLSEDPQQHYLPRPERVAPIFDDATTDTESVSHHDSSLQIFTAENQSRSNIQGSPRIERNTKSKGHGVQKKIIKTKHAKTTRTGQKAHADGRAAIREQLAKEEVEKAIREAETAAGSSRADRFRVAYENTAAEPLPSNEQDLDVKEQHKIIFQSTSTKDPQTPLRQTSAESLTSPPAMSRSPHHSHHGSYMEFQVSPSELRCSVRDQDPALDHSNDDNIFDEESKVNDQTLNDQEPVGKISPKDDAANSFASWEISEDLRDELGSLAGSLHLSDEGDDLPSSVLSPSIMREPLAAYRAQLDDVTTWPEL